MLAVPSSRHIGSHVTKTLRDYQQAGVTALFRYFAEGNGGNPVVAMPTGTGKSLTLAGFQKEAYLMYPGQRFLNLTHVKELIKQDYDAMRSLWSTAPAGVYSAGLKRKESHYPITFAGVASVAQCPELFGRVDLAFIDEAHLLSPKDGTMYRRIIKTLKGINPLLKVVGFTATPFRLGQGMLTDEGGLFTDVCFDLTGLDAFNWFFSEGYLVPPIPRRTQEQLDTENVGTTGGEFIQSELQAAVDREDITFRCMRETIQYGSERRHWLIFASGVDHAIHVRDMLESLGVSATCVHSRMSDEERDRSLADFTSGRVRAMVNNGILTTGFDFPGIDLICMLRPTQSPGLWVQMLGRGTRPVYSPGHDLTTREGRLASIAASGKHNCLVLDFARNAIRLGPINDPVLPKRKGKGNRPAPVKTCEVCGTYNHTSARVCINCGAAFHIAVKIAPGASSASLVATSEPGVAPKDLPQIEPFKVERIVYSEHKKRDRPTSLRVSYYCGFRMFEEWVCLEHEGYARRRAMEWWRRRILAELNATPPPRTVAEAMLRTKELRAPSTIRVWINKERPEITGVEFEGTPPLDVTPPPGVVRSR